MDFFSPSTKGLRSNSEVSWHWCTLLCNCVSKLRNFLVEVNQIFFLSIVNFNYSEVCHHHSFGARRTVKKFGSSKFRWMEILFVVCNSHLVLYYICCFCFASHIQAKLLCCIRLIKQFSPKKPIKLSVKELWNFIFSNYC